MTSSKKENDQKKWLKRIWNWKKK